MSTLESKCVDVCDASFASFLYDEMSRTPAARCSSEVY